MAFEFATAGRILFGAGQIKQVPTLAAASGKRALLVRGSSRRVAADLVPALEAQGLSVAEWAVTREPDTDMIAQGMATMQATDADVVIGVGGGSVLDTAKALAVLATNDADHWLDYLEIVGNGAVLQRPGWPCIAVPTTAGTGSEVTRNAVIGVPEHRVKVSLRHAFLLPRYAVIDPDLARGLPPTVTAYTGLDALVQCLEVFVSPHGNPLTTALCREGLAQARQLEKAWRGEAPVARSAMALAALCGGLGLANAKLGAVHGLAGPLGGWYGADHGALCAALVAPVWRMNTSRLQQSGTNASALDRYAEAARILVDSPDATIEDGARWIESLCTTLQIPPLSTLGVDREDLSACVAKAEKSSSMKGNPVQLTEAELMTILEESGV